MSFITTKIIIQKNQNGLGFILSGQNPCIVSSVTHNGPADIATLKAGDEILEVDFVNVSHLKHDEVVRHIMNDNNEKVVLCVRRFSNNDCPKGQSRNNINSGRLDKIKTAKQFSIPVCHFPVPH